ncbi:MAG: hypothetical protein JNM17_29005 [Archangium sp.]|nr:hypothetical protein [Archangium sp.]
MMRFATAVLAVFTLCACGGNNPGSGSGTLFVSARFSTDGSPSASAARVTIREAGPFGALVKDATVNVSGSKAPKTNIPYVEMNNEYRVDQFPWDEIIRLEVTRGQDRVEGSVTSPGTSQITNPTNDGTVRQANGLTISWRDSNMQPANTVRVRMYRSMIDTTLADDKFEFNVAFDKLVVADDENVNLERSNEVALAGGTAGSAMSVTTYHSVRFRIEP